MFTFFIFYSTLIVSHISFLGLKVEKLKTTMCITSYPATRALSWFETLKKSRFEMF